MSQDAGEIFPLKERGSSQLTHESRAFVDFKTLKSTAFEAIHHGDLAALDPCILEWQYLCDTAENFLYEAVILMNPLAKAVASRRYTVIQHLVNSCGLRLEPFHEKNCVCRLCTTLADDLRFQQLYVVTIVASAASPWYVFCAHCDTAIETTLHLRHHLEPLQCIVGHKPCDEVIDNIQETLVLALECACNEREAFELLQDVNDETETPVEGRLKTILHFVDLELKRAVEHPTVQSVLLHEWGGGEPPHQGKMAFLFKDGILGTFLTGTFLYFIVAPLLILFPHPKLVKYLEKPSVRFQTKFVSFIFLFVVAITTSMYTYLDVLLICTRRSESPELYRISVWQGFLGILIAGKIVKTMTGIFYAGKRMIVGMYDVLYFTSINLFVAGTTLILIAIFIIPERNDVREICRNWIIKIPNIKQLGLNCTLTNDIYKQYPHALSLFDTIAEPYIIGSVLVGGSFLVYLVSVGAYLYNFKPVALFAITCQILVKDVAKWVLFFLFFMFGWCFAFKTVYSNFICNTSFFNSITDTLTELFWIIFAMSGTTDYQLTGSVATRKLWSKHAVNTMGIIMYMGFFIVGTLILINLLIALMSVSYERLEDNKRQEVYFWRSKMMIKYILWNDSLPLPWNLLYPIYFFTRTLWRNGITGQWDRRFIHSYAYNRIVHENQMRTNEHEIIRERINAVYDQMIKELKEGKARKKKSA